MKNTIKNVDSQTLITISGRMDLSNTQELEKQLKPMLKIKKPNISIDCSELQYISSNGLRAFISLLKYIRAKEGQIFLTSIKPEVESILDTAGFSMFVKRK
ncbi:STAS domain-containing protein [Chryseobacterium potabilaquae]|uniref:Anti-sigma factor antagonist n=1 Tax=Chryseobacterium potabilaquae TaxID=2675057 RepID=A0A6N4XDG1_9FLAO|nr:STAS domain-containing protein [Chryseobacterium potabilaquae]CAA7196614.1 Putative anti-sigma factor antagonist BtrV [Chryseobacterium potabilaquae]